jgi:hypothetical protein
MHEPSRITYIVRSGDSVQMNHQTKVDRTRGPSTGASSLRLEKTLSFVQKAEEIPTIGVSQNNASPPQTRSVDSDTLAIKKDSSTGCVHQEILEAQITSSDISKPVNLVVSSNVLMDQVALVRSRCTYAGSAVTLLDLESYEPKFSEVLRLVESRNRSPKTRLLRVVDFYLSSDKLKDEFISLWQVIVDLFRSVIIYGLKIDPRRLRGRMLRVWLNYSILTSELPSSKVVLGDEFNYSRWTKTVKYKLAAFAAWGKKSDVLPKSPFTMDDNPSWILDREFTEDFIFLRKGCDYWAMSLIDTLCRGVKKGAPRATDEDCLINCLETAILFTTPKVKPTYLGLTVSDMETEIERTVDEILGDALFEPKWNSCPSFSSCTENKLHNGGHVKVVKQHIAPYPRTLTVKVKHGMAYEPTPDLHCNHTEDPDPQCVAPLVSEDQGESVSEYGEMRSIKYLEITNNPDHLGTDLDIEQLCRECLEKPSVIKPIGLKEALKVRGITTPAALETWLTRPLQQFLFKQLKQHAVFGVTATPLRAEHLQQAFQVLFPGEKIVSGDYDNATNMMIGSYTRVCIRRICSRLGLSEDYSRICERALCDCEFDFTYFNNADVKREFKATQIEAQPMGKVLSFSILCIVNFAVCRKACELDCASIITINKFRGLINGDDCCFPIKNFDHWVGCSAMVGLNNSIGKTFWADSFVEMNSRTFLLDGKRDSINLVTDIHFTEIPFLNFGLMKGMVRSDGGGYSNTDVKKISSEYRELAEAVSRMGWCHRELTRGFEFAFDDLTNLFKHYHNRFLLSPYLEGIPYHIPTWLGGLGLGVGHQPQWLISDVQRKCAGWIYQNFNKLKPANVALSKTCLLDDIVEREFDRLLKENDVQDIDPFQRLETEDGIFSVDIQQENQLVYGQVIESTWRTKELNQFFVDVDDDFILLSSRIAAKKLQHNTDIWRQAFAICEYKQPDRPVLPWYKIWAQKKMSVRPIVGADATRENVLWSVLARHCNQ